MNNENFTYNFYFLIPKKNLKSIYKTVRDFSNLKSSFLRPSQIYIHDKLPKTKRENRKNPDFVFVEVEITCYTGMVLFITTSFVKFTNNALYTEEGMDNYIYFGTGKSFNAFMYMLADRLKLCKERKDSSIFKDLMLSYSSEMFINIDSGKFFVKLVDYGLYSDKDKDEFYYKLNEDYTLLIKNTTGYLYDVDAVIKIMDKLRFLSISAEALLDEVARLIDIRFSKIRKLDFKDFIADKKGA